MNKLARGILALTGVVAALVIAASASLWYYQSNRLWSHERPLRALLHERPTEEVLLARLGTPWRTVIPATAGEIRVSEWWPSKRTVEVRQKLRTYPRTLLYVEAPGLPRQSVVDFVFLDSTGKMAEFICVRN